MCSLGGLSRRPWRVRRRWRRRSIHATLAEIWNVCETLRHVVLWNGRHWSGPSGRRRGARSVWILERDRVEALDHLLGPGAGCSPRLMGHLWVDKDLLDEVLRGPRGRLLCGGLFSPRTGSGRSRPVDRRWPESGPGGPVRHDHGLERAVSSNWYTSGILRWLRRLIEVLSAGALPYVDRSAQENDGIRARPRTRAGSPTIRAATPTSGWPFGSGWRQPGRRSHAPGSPRSLQAGDARDELRDGRRSLRARLQVPLGEAERLLELHHRSTPPLAVERSRGRSGLPPPPAIHAVRVATLGASGTRVRADPPKLARAVHRGRDDAGRPRRALAGRRPGRRRDPRRASDRGGGGRIGRPPRRPGGDGRGQPAGLAPGSHAPVGRPGDPAGGPVPAEHGEETGRWVSPIPARTVELARHE